MALKTIPNPLLTENYASRTAIIEGGLSVKGDLSSKIAGKVTVGVGSTSVTGTGTNFTNDLEKDSAILIAGEVFTVSTIISNISLVLDTVHVAGATNVDVFIDVDPINIVTSDGATILNLRSGGKLTLNGVLAGNDYSGANFNIRSTTAGTPGTVVFDDQLVIDGANNKLYGSAEESGNFTVYSTIHATKGKILFGGSGTTYYDEVTNGWSLGGNLTVSGEIKSDSLGNTSNGTSTLSALTTGFDNIAIGKNAGDTVTTGSSNILLGINADASSSSGINQIVIGESGIGSGDNETVIGNANTSKTTIAGIITGNGSGLTNLSLSGPHDGDGAGLTGIPASTGVVVSGTADSVAIGTGALALVTGVEHVAIGTRALAANTTGIENVAVGWSALETNIVGNYNTAVGKGTLKLATNNKNVAVGHLSGSNVTTGDSNTFLGSAAGSLTTTGSNNICIGDSVYTSSSSASNEVILGNDGITKTILRGKIGLGTVNPNWPLTIETTEGNTINQRSYSTTSGSGIILGRSKNDTVGVQGLLADGDRIGTLHFEASDGAGFKWASYIAASVDGVASAGNIPTRLEFGTSSGAANPIANLTINSDGKVIVSNTLQVDGAVTFLNDLSSDGTATFNNVSVEGNYLSDPNGNSQFGSGALSAVTTGSNNICIGLNAGDTVITGDRNILIGRNADVNSGSTTNSIVIGDSYTALISNQAVFGNPNILSTILQGAIQGGTSFISPTITAITLNTTTLDATGVITGDGDGLVNLHGGTLGNALFGTSAGNALTTGSDNTYLGKNAGLLATTGTNNICIGNGADLSSATASNETVIGNTSTTSTLVHGYTKLGASAPAMKVHYEEGTTAAGVTTSVAVGGTIADNIMSIEFLVQEFNGEWHKSGDGGSTQNIYWGNTTVHLDNVVAAQQGRPFRLYITYIATL